MMRWATK